MVSLSDDNQADVIEAINSTSRNLDDLFNIDYPYFEDMVNRINQIYPPELQLNKANDADTEAPVLGFYIHLFLSVLFNRKVMISATILNLK